MQKPSMFYPLLLLVFWTGLMTTADSVVIATSVRQTRSVDFATTTGKMVQSEVGRGAMSHRGVEMGYNYTVDGISYTGHHYRYDDRNAAWEYSTAVDAFPRWSSRRVYYNPNDPADSVLDPGLDGCDLLLLLFATPLNVVTLALWVAVLQSRRKRSLSETAGGVPIIKKHGEIRAHLAAFSPGGAALAALGAAAFVLAFPVVSIGGFKPTMTVMIVVWVSVVVATVTAFIWTWNKNRSGTYDLHIDEASMAVTVPQIGGRRIPMTLARDEILAVSLQCRIAKTPSGDYFSYLPAIDRVTGATGSLTVNLVTWGWTETKARAFGHWLSEQLGVEFRGVHGDRTP
jgi:hypothetical protein